MVEVVGIHPGDAQGRCHVRGIEGQGQVIVGLLVLGHSISSLFCFHLLATATLLRHAARVLDLIWREIEETNAFDPDGKCPVLAQKRLRNE